MKAQIKRLWTGALRSGRYQQGRGELRKQFPYEGKMQYCCLGVLCDLYALAHPEANVWATMQTTRTSVLPARVLEWAGLPVGRIPSVERYGRFDGLSNLNDYSEMSFGELAEVIDEHMPETE